MTVYTEDEFKTLCRLRASANQIVSCETQRITDFKDLKNYIITVYSFEWKCPRPALEKSPWDTSNLLCRLHEPDMQYLVFEGVVAQVHQRDSVEVALVGSANERRFEMFDLANHPWIARPRYTRYGSTALIRFGGDCVTDTMIHIV